MLEQKKADVQITQSSSAARRGSPEDDDGDIVPDDTVVSGDITDPEFLQIMVSRLDTFFEHKSDMRFSGKEAGCIQTSSRAEQEREQGRSSIEC